RSVGRPRSVGQLFADQSAGADRAPGIFGLMAGPLFCERAAANLSLLSMGASGGAFHSRRTPVPRPANTHDARREAKAMALGRTLPLVGNFQIYRDQRAHGRRGK